MLLQLKQKKRLSLSKGELLRPNVAKPVLNKPQVSKTLQYLKTIQTKQAHPKNKPEKAQLDHPKKLYKMLMMQLIPKW